MNNIPPFYIGQKVVYITGHNMPKDTIHTVLDLKKYPCGCNVIKIETPSKHQKKFCHTTYLRCSQCKNLYLTEEGIFGYWAASSFQPIKESPFPSLTFQKVIEKESELVSLN